MRAVARQLASSAVAGAVHSSTPASSAASLADRALASSASIAFESCASGVAARLQFQQQQSRRGFHSSAASQQKTAAKAGAAKSKPASSQAAVVFMRAGEAPPPSPGSPQTFDFTKPLLPKHQLLYKPPARDPANRWTPQSVRVGVIGLKCGMTADWDAWGVRHALTVIKLEDCMVTGVATDGSRGYTALQVGAGEPKVKNVSKPLLGYFSAQGVPPKEKLAEFRVTSDALLPIGTPLYAQHFMPGQAVNIQASGSWVEGYGGHDVAA